MEMLKYFMDCYFNMGADTDELDDLINDFKTREISDYKRNFIKDLYNIMYNNDYEVASKIIKKHGNRTFSIHMTKVFIKYLYDRLNDIPTHLTPLDFYKMK